MNYTANGTTTIYICLILKQSLNNKSKFKYKIYFWTFLSCPLIFFYLHLLTKQGNFVVVKSFIQWAWDSEPQHEAQIKSTHKVKARVYNV